MFYVGVPHPPYIVRQGLGYKSASIYESYLIWNPKEYIESTITRFLSLSPAASGIRSPSHLLHVFPELQCFDLIFKHIICLQAHETSRRPVWEAAVSIGPSNGPHTESTP